MGRKKTTSEYNDFLDGEKLRDNVNVRTSLQQTTPASQPQAAPHHHVEPPHPRQDRKRKSKTQKGPKKPPLTHFLCLPLVNEASRPQLEASLSTLEEEIKTSGIVPVKAIRPVGTLHLTLGVMSLDDEEELEGAKRFLHEFDVARVLRDITGRVVAERAAEMGAVCENLNASALPDVRALSVDLVGLVAMQKPGQTSILYAEPRDGSGRLVSFAEALRRKFAVGGGLLEDKRSLRLHATVVNTIYAKPKGRRGRNVGLDGDGARLQQRHGLVSGEAQRHNDDDEGDEGDGASTAGSVQDIEEQTSAPPDPSTVETHVAATRAFDGSDGHGPNAKSWMRFDARDLMDKFKDAVWAKDVRIDRVQICKMGAKKTYDSNGQVISEEYEVVAEKII